MIEVVLKSFWLHPFRWLFGIAAIGLFVFVLFSGSNNNQPSQETLKAKEEVSQESSPDPALPPSNGSPGPTAPPENTNQEEETTEKPNPDPIKADESPAEVLQGQKIAAERAALPFLPLKTPSVQAEYINQLENGDLLIKVRYRRSKAEAISVWQKFLDKYQDPGTAYLVVYEPV